MGAPERPIEILLVEDNPGDVNLIERAFSLARLPNTLRVVGDGEAALEYVRREGRYAGAPRPDLILLDLNLPRKHGREVLADLKADPELRRIPVVVLTSSADERDVLRSYDLHANSYVTKPVAFESLIRVIRSIESFWIQVVTLPAR